MAYFNVCRICGAHLDPGEPCECKEESKQREEMFNQLINEGKDGQFYLEGIYGLRTG